MGSHDNEPATGEFSWHELAAADGRAAWDFYHALFGWEQAGAMDMGPNNVYQMFGRGGGPLGGMYTKPPEMREPRWLCYVRVHDVDATAAAIAQRGGRITSGPMEVPGGDRIANCVDPQGAPFAIHAKAKVQQAPRSVAKAPAKAAGPKKSRPKAATPRKTARPKAPKAQSKKAAKRGAAPKSKKRGARVAKKAKRPAAKARRRITKPPKRRGRR